MMTETARQMMNAEKFIRSKLTKDFDNQKFKVIWEASLNLEAALNEYIKESKPKELENVFWHIGFIRGACES